jgi:hypothetical protein
VIVVGREGAVALVDARRGRDFLSISVCYVIMLITSLVLDVCANPPPNVAFLFIAVRLGSMLSLKTYCLELSISP